jgi:hypothetical protein
MKNKMIDLHNALFAELETLQDEDTFKDAEGNIDSAKVELAIKRADKVSDVAGKIMELQRLQLDAVKLAVSNGIPTRLPETLGIESPGGQKSR